MEVNSKKQPSIKSVVILLIAGLLMLTDSPFAQSDLYGIYPVYREIAYKNADSVKLTMDIIHPLEKGDHPTVVYIHGGNWDYGNKLEQLEKYYSPIFKSLLKNNIIIATVNYRLASDEIHMPIPVIDAKDAIRFLKKHGKKYGINGKRISIWGTSAGGHIAQITGFSSEDQFQGDVALANYTSKVNLIINCFGPVDMNRIFRTDFSAIEVFFAKIFRPNDYDKLLLISRHFSGLDFEDDREELIEFCNEYTSINFITKDSPPVITLQGLADDIVDPEHALILQSALDHYYVPNILKEYEDVEHSFLEASEAQWSDISKSMVDMIYKYN